MQKAIANIHQIDLPIDRNIVREITLVGAMQRAFKVQNVKIKA